MNIYKSYLKLLTEFVAIKSISTSEEFKPEIDKAIAWLQDQFTANKFAVQILPGKITNPVVFAEYIVNKKLPTVLIYGHYDVQPADLEQGWLADPFKLREEKNKLVGRGAVDNKGQISIHMATVFALIKAGTLGYNVRFLIEGNEETGNDDMTYLLQEYRGILKPDYVLVSDGEISGNTPTIEESLRGGMNMRVILRTAKQDVHSGIYGGAIPNAVHEAGNLIARLFNSDNMVAYPEFYRDVDPISEEQWQHLRKADAASIDMLKHVEVNKLLTEPGQTFSSQVGLRPTIQVTGLKAGYINDGFSNIVPAVAEIRLNFRLVASQNTEQVVKGFENYLAQTMPEYVTYTTESFGLHQPVKINIDSQIHRKVAQYLNEAYQVPALIKNVGGAIPFVGDIKEIFDLDTILVSLGNDDCNMHGPEENFRLDLVHKGLKFSELFFTNQGQ